MIFFRGRTRNIFYPCQWYSNWNIEGRAKGQKPKIKIDMFRENSKSRKCPLQTEIKRNRPKLSMETENFKPWEFLNLIKVISCFKCTLQNEKSNVELHEIMKCYPWFCRMQKTGEECFLGTQQFMSIAGVSHFHAKFLTILWIIAVNISELFLLICYKTQLQMGTYNFSASTSTMINIFFLAILISIGWFSFSRLRD